MIGFGKITKKKITHELVWPDEKLFQRPLWPYKFEFDTLFIVNDWKNGVEIPKTIILRSGRVVLNEKVFIPPKASGQRMEYRYIQYNFTSPHLKI